MALAIERFRLKNSDRLPRLDELTPAFLDSPPRDPVDDSALEYRLNNGTGYQVLAVGASELSNQGRKATNRLDISFTIVR